MPNLKIRFTLTVSNRRSKSVHFYHQGYRNSSDDMAKGSLNLANASLIKRFNHHSTMVLKSCDNRSRSATQIPATAEAVVNGAASKLMATVKNSNSVAVTSSKQVWISFSINFATNFNPVLSTSLSLLDNRIIYFIQETCHNPVWSDHLYSVGVRLNVQENWFNTPSL